MKILVTGTAGFVGMHTAARLLARGDQVVGIDNLSPYYDPGLKRARLARLESSPGFRFRLMDLADRDAVATLFRDEQFDRVVHLAAQPGVRYSIENPHAYADSNLVGFLNILEGCRHHAVQHLVYASSSSVYGGNTKMPFAETDSVDRPVSLYAATKKANELMAYTYSHLYRIPATGLRFFTVYGPWGRPDMAYYLFTAAILAGHEIKVFNHGDMQRDFTYIDDIVEGVVRVLDRIATPESSAAAPHRLFNIGNQDPVQLLDMITCLEGLLGAKAKRAMLPMQAGDVPATFADVRSLSAWVGFQPATPLSRGLSQFVDWYRSYHRA